LEVGRSTFRTPFSIFKFFHSDAFANSNVFQDGIIVDTVEDWLSIGGQRFRDVSRHIFDGDSDIISTLATFEHMSIISQSASSPNIPIQVI
jgi:hypothetical protein